MIQDDYGVVSDEILYDIAYAINVNAPNFGSTEWLTKRMQELGRFNAKQRNRIYNVAYSNDLTTLAWKTLRDIEHEFPQTKGIIPRDERVRLTVRAVANQTSQYFGVLNATMLRSADQLYQTALTEVERRMLLATEAVMTGMTTKMSVTKDVIDLVQKLGITGFIDKSGRKWSAEAYADLVTRSSMGNIQRQIMVDRCHDYGEDIVYAPIKFPSRPMCADWQGKLLSLSDQRYTTTDLYDRPMEVFPYSDAVGHPAGLWGCNCGHGHAVFIPNLSEVVEPVNKMTPEQNAEAYALTQQERQLERNVRNNKTKVKMLEKAGVTGDGLDQAKNKLKQSRANYREFLNRYGYDPTAGRTYVHGFSPSKKYNDAERSILGYLKKSGIEYKEVPLLKKKLTEQQIIDKLSGGDKTKGSCVSLALAYAGNMLGYDVTDFRGGRSQNYFAFHAGNIARLDGVVSKKIKSSNDIKASLELLRSIDKDNKEYMLVTGRHCAIVRKDVDEFEYLELQSRFSSRNIFKPLDEGELKWRFDCKKSHTSYGQKIEWDNYLIDVASLKNSSAFRELLGYINTDPTKQMKGTTGDVK